MYSVARLCPDQSFLSLSYRRYVAGLSMLSKVNSNSNHCLFSVLLLEFDISELRPQLIHWSLKYQGVERPKLQGLSCRLWFECGMTFPTVFDTGTEDGFKGAVNRWLLPSVVLCSVFRGAGDCGVAKVIYKQFRFSYLGLCCWF